MLFFLLTVSGDAALAPPGAVTYYVDAKHGRDTNSGTTPEAPWRSLERVRHTRLTPGSQLLLAGGQTFSGTIQLDGEDSGSAETPILISSFGKGRARIDGGSGNGIALQDCAFVTVRNLDIVGCGRKNGSDGAGVLLHRTNHIDLSHLDVSGFRVAGIATEGDTNTRITHVYAHDNGAAGISASGGYDDVPRAKNLYIGDCIAENNPGDPKNHDNHSGNGIIVGGVDEALIEYCAASNNGWDMPREGNGPVGIWGWNCDRLTIQHCISFDNKSPGTDGGGFDFDGGVTNSVLQYNLSYNNHGCGYLLCQYPGASRWQNNIVRYNISYNDGSKNFQAGIGLWLGDNDISGAQIYNNTIVNPKHAVSSMGELPDFVYRNNIFVAGGDMLVGDFLQSHFENNLYWMTGKDLVFFRNESQVFSTIAEWVKATGQEQNAGKSAYLFADPQLLLPSSNAELPTQPRKLAAMRFFSLGKDSPGHAAGRIIVANGGQDLSGHLLSPETPPAMGARER